MRQREILIGRGKLGSGVRKSAYATTDGAAANLLPYPRIPALSSAIYVLASPMEDGKICGTVRSSELPSFYQFYCGRIVYVTAID